MLRLSGISKKYGELPVLDGISLDVRAGEVVGVIGPSGCGKSTLLRVINGLVAVDRGTVTIGGVTLTALNARELRQGIGYVVQGGGLFPHLTARQNVTLAARVRRGWLPEQIHARVELLAEMVRLGNDELNRYPAELSGGQNQRVSLMRALMLNPPLVLLDEPLAALDPMVRSGLQDELRTLFEHLKKTVVFVTHDLAEADRLSDRIVLIKHGHVVQSGELADLVGHPATEFVRRFVEAYRAPRILADR